MSMEVFQDPCFGSAQMPNPLVDEDAAIAMAKLQEINQQVHRVLKGSLYALYTHYLYYTRNGKVYPPSEGRYVI